MFLTDKPPSKGQSLPPLLAVCLVRVSTWAREKGIGRKARRKRERKRERERESRGGSEREDLRLWLLWSDFVCAHVRERVMKNIPLRDNNVSLFVYMLLPALLCTVPACNFMLEQHARNFSTKLFFFFLLWDNGILQSEMYQVISPQPAPARLCLTDTFHHWWEKETPDCWSHLSHSEGIFTRQGGPSSTPQKPPGAWSVYECLWM